MTSTLGKNGFQFARWARSTATTAAVTVADVSAARLSGLGVPAARAIGATREQIRSHIERSRFQSDGTFSNLEPPAPVPETDLAVVGDMIRRPGRPRTPVPVLTPVFAEPARDLAFTWLGHASMLVELDGVRILTDPVLSRRCSPSQTIGPGRMHPAPVRPDDLPPIDIVLLSHDHYDHLDTTTVVSIARNQPDAVFVAPIGVGAHLAVWGIGPERVREADWWESVELSVAGTTVTLTAAPARHFSGRWLTRNGTQWASWSVHGPDHRFFFSGDTGFTERFAEVGSRLGPFDLTLIAVGAYDPLWPDIHVNPEEAVRVHGLVTDVTDSLMVPIHWGTFNLARHSWGDPIARLLPAAESGGASVVVPQPGGEVDVIDRTGTGLTDPAWWERSA